jgi:type I site-specific restriction endonuclease
MSHRPEKPRKLTESDIEQSVVWSLLTNPLHLGIPTHHIRTKEVNSELLIGKGESLKRFAPDYLIYAPSAVPLIVGEAKAPTESVAAALREARQYAAALNAKYPTGVNPISYVFGCNGEQFAYGPNDTEQAVSCRWRIFRQSAAPCIKLSKTCSTGRASPTSGVK